MIYILVNMIYNYIMKKYMQLALIMALTGCNITASKGEIMTVNTDLSDYQELNMKQAERFKEIDLDSLQDVITNHKTAVIYLGYSACDNCQKAIVKLAILAEECGATVYYLDTLEAFTDDADSYEKGLELLDPVLEESNATQGKAIICPELILVQNGEYKDWYIGIDENIDERYREILNVQK